MSVRQPSFLSRALEPFQAGLWVLFLLWTVIVAVVWIGGFGAVEMEDVVTNAGLRSALDFLLRTLDAAWFALAGANVYLALAEAESLAVARRWASAILGCAWIVAALSVWTAFPLGAIHYTARLGMRIGPVPFGLLMMWLAFVIGARALALRVMPRAGHFQVCLAASALVGLTAANLDPLAWRFRALWLWRDAGQWGFLQNAATWMLAAFGLAFFMRETRVASVSEGGFPRPAIVLIVLNFVFLMTHGARLLRD